MSRRSLKGIAGIGLVVAGIVLIANGIIDVTERSAKLD